MKRSTHILIILLGAVVLGVIVIVANVARSHSQVSGLKIKIDYAGQPRLVGDKVVTDSIMRLNPGLLQQQVRNVDLESVSEAASRVPYLTDCDASVSVGGKIVVKANQRRPIARVFYGEREFYIDGEGRAMPPSATGDCYVTVAGGNFAERIDTLLYNRLDIKAMSTDSATKNYGIVSVWKMACYLDANPDYGCLFDQMYLAENGDMILVPKLGDHTVVVGRMENLDNKFARLQVFYTKVMPDCGWDAYSKLDLKFDDQVVCTKKTK